MSAKLPHFEIDRNGLAAILHRRGTAFAITELIQNSWDEDGVTTVRVELEPIPGKPLARVLVEDDAPEGFADIAYAYTMFKASKKVHDPEKRGRFAAGEKLFLSVAETATIATTKGTVVFDRDGREHFPRRKRERGSVVEAVIRMTRADYDEACQLMRMLIPPVGMTTTFNGEQLAPREPVAVFEQTLATEIADSEGNLKPTKRKATVKVYEPLEGETAHLYELGIPVVETGDRFHVSVEQKIPVSIDRTNLITPGYLRDVRTAVINHTAHLLSKQDASEKWIDDALEDPDVSKEAVEKALDLRFGTKRVLADPSDPEAVGIAVSQGYTIIPSRGLSKEAFKNVRRFEAALPAGRVTPSPKPYSDDPSAPVRKELPQSEWTDDMRRIADFSKRLHKALFDEQPVDVRIVNDPNVMNFAATYRRAGFGPAMLEFNMRKLGRKWFERANTDQEVLRLFIHEAGHHDSGNHLSSDYHEALCKIGAKLTRLALENPTLFTD